MLKRILSTMTLGVILATATVPTMAATDAITELYDEYRVPVKDYIMTTPPTSHASSVSTANEDLSLPADYRCPVVYIPGIGNLWEGMSVETMRNKAESAGYILVYEREGVYVYQEPNSEYETLGFSTLDGYHQNINYVNQLVSSVVGTKAGAFEINTIYDYKDLRHTNIEGLEMTQKGFQDFKSCGNLSSYYATRDSLGNSTGIELEHIDRIGWENASGVRFAEDGSVATLETTRTSRANKNGITIGLYRDKPEISEEEAKASFAEIQNYMQSHIYKYIDLQAYFEASRRNEMLDKLEEILIIPSNLRAQ